jgi:hypothetical protein
MSTALPIPATAAPAAIEPPAKAPAFIGSVDGLDATGALEGWLYNPDASDERLVAWLYHDERSVARGTADILRPDVHNSGYGDGCYGFRISLPATLCDGNFHVLSIWVECRLGLFEWLQHFGIAHRRDPSDPIAGTRRDVAALQLRLLGPPALEVVRSDGFEPEVVENILKISGRFGHAAAIDMLYVYALGRHADGSREMIRLKSNEGEREAIKAIVSEVLASEEFLRVNAGSYLAAPNTLAAWGNSPAAMVPL